MAFKKKVEKKKEIRCTKEEGFNNLLKTAGR